jgi:hypothetical protein
MAFVLFATFAGLVLLAVGIVGRRAKGIPLCRACNADVRDAAWDASPRCPRCNADLSRGGSVRLEGKRQRRRELIAAAVCAALAIGVAGTDLWLGAKGLRWRDLRPASLELRAARSANAPVAWDATRSLERRLGAAWLSPDHQEAWLQQLLAPGPLAQGPATAAASDGTWPSVGTPTASGACGGPTQGPAFELARSPDTRPSWGSLVASGPITLTVQFDGWPRALGDEARLVATAVCSPPAAVPAWILPRDVALDGNAVAATMSVTQASATSAAAATRPGLTARVRTASALPPQRHAFVVRAWLVFAPLRSQLEVETLLGDAIRELEASGVTGERDLSDRFGIPVRVVPIEGTARFETAAEYPGEILPPDPGGSAGDDAGRRE